MRPTIVLPASGKMPSVLPPGWHAAFMSTFLLTLAVVGSISRGPSERAGWLGFAMGSDTSLALSDHRQSIDTGLLPELFDPGTGFVRDLGEGLRT